MTFKAGQVITFKGRDGEQRAEDLQHELGSERCTRSGRTVTLMRSVEFHFERDSASIIRNSIEDFTNPTGRRAAIPTLATA